MNSETADVPVIVTVFRNWNWKAAILSGAMRAPIFFFTTIHFGWRAMTVAASVEFAYRVISAGFFASFIQHRRRLGTWQAALQITVLVPLLCLSLNYVLHLAMGTPNLKVGMAVSFAVSAITSGFNWYSMSRGLFITGGEGRSLFRDLQALPKVLLDFVIAPAVYVRRLGRQAFGVPR